MILMIVLLANLMNNAKEEGKALGQSGQSQALFQMQQIPSHELIPKEEQGKPFDSNIAKEEAKKCAKNADYTSGSEDVNYLRDIQNNKILSEDEYFIQRSENISQNAQLDNFESEEACDYKLETCHRSDAPELISVIRDLKVDVAFIPAEFKEFRICARHRNKEKFYWKKDAKKRAQELRNTLANDPDIKWYEVDDPKEGGMFHDYIVEARWEHHKNIAKCNNYQAQVEEIHPVKWEEVGESWMYEDATFFSASKSPDYTFINSECLDSIPSKMINGKEVKRQCWKEKLTYIFSSFSDSNSCPFIKNKNCELIRKQCLKEGAYGCNLWELTFKCYSKFIKKSLGESALLDLNEEHSYEPNDSFSEVTAKLAVFDEIKKELENDQVNDARRVQVFKGQKMQCGKSVVDKLMYDCCFSYGGIAKEFGLKNCKADEIALAEMRENGLCHYVGSYDEKFLELWKSRKEHVFCCFGTKLARILQENARDQLKFGWKEPEEADCRGLSLDEISQLDFTAMDFSELYTDCNKQIPANFQDKLEAFKSKVEQKVKSREENHA